MDTAIQFGKEMKDRLQMMIKFKSDIAATRGKPAFIYEGGVGGKVVVSAGSVVTVAAGLNDPNLLVALAIPTEGAT